MNEITDKDIGTAKVLYILIIVATIILVSGLIALIIAYVMKNDADDVLASHYRFQIRTIWIGLLYSITGSILIGSPLAIIGIGVLLFTFFWIVIRCAKGLKRLQQSLPVENVTTWSFG